MTARVPVTLEGVLRQAAGLRRRERGLIVLLFLAALPLALWFGVITPQHANRAAARVALSDAAALRDWVAAQSAATAGRAAPDSARAAQAAGPGPAPIGISGLEQSLVATGLRGDVTRLADQGDGTILLGFERVRFLALTDWLTALVPSWGYEVAGFRFERGDAPDTVAAEFRLAPRLAGGAK